MGTFKAKSVEPIKWDVQGWPKRDPETGKTVGKWVNGEEHAQGEIAEPDDEQVQSFLEGYAEIVTEIAEALQLAETDPEAAAQVPPDFYAKQRDRMTEILVGVGAPRELLDGLPPRLFRAFADHVSGDLQGEAVSAG